MLLAKNGQELTFEPMSFAALYGTGSGTIGGAIMANLSGPRRIKAGAARDFVLGVKAVSGRGEAFKAGGRVVKNVTGYDLSRGRFSVASKFVRHVRRLRTLHHNGRLPETQNRGLRRAMARDVSRAHFRPVTCRALCCVGAASGRRKSEEPPLLLPIVRQIPGGHDKPCRRQLDGLLTDQDRATISGER
jgi:FAD/FMN-containing dehydrogenase